MEQAIIDFIIVVSGILLALLLNRLISRREHRKRITNIMNIVTNNFNNDLIRVKETIGRIDSREKLFNQVIDAESMNDKEIKESMNLTTNYPRFNISTRGYNLLKDSKVDFDFKDSDLISQVVNCYDSYLDGIASYSQYLRDNTERNFRSFSKHSWGVEFYNDKVTPGYVDYLRTNEYRAKVSYHYKFMTGPWANILTKYKDQVKIILEKIDASDYK